MEVELWVQDRWSIYGLKSDHATPSEELDELAINYSTHIDGLFSILDMVSKEVQGPRVLNDKICHTIDKEHGIWQISKGRIRLLWFYDEGRCIICTHAFLKKSQKTPKATIAKAIKLQKQYHEAKTANGGEINVVDQG